MDSQLTAAREQLQRYERYLQQDPNNARLLEDSAELLLSLGEPAKARKYLEDALLVKRGDPNLRFKLGAACLASGDAERAYGLYRELSDDGVNHPSIAYNRAHAAFGAGRPAEAVELLDAIPEAKRSELPRYSWLRARALYHARQNNAANEEIGRFLAASPGDLDGLALQAQIIEDTGDLHTAAAIAARVLAIRPEDVACNLVAGEVAMFLQQPDVAEQHLRKVIERVPINGRAWSALAFVSIDRRQFDQAIQYFKRAVTHMPDHLGTWHGMAWCQILRSDLVGARQSVEAAMQVDRTFADNHGTLAVILFFQGKQEEAQQSMKRGVRLNPNSAASQFANSLLLSVKGDKAGSDRIVRSIIETRKLADGTPVEQAITRYVASLGRPTR